MEPRIDSVVLAGPNGRHATASGPINWDPDETSATFGAAITQVDTSSGEIVLAIGQNPHVFTRANDLRWSAQVDVVGGGRLNPGTGDGWAVASVLEAAGGYEAYPWEVDDLTITAAADAQHGDVVSARQG